MLALGGFFGDINGKPVVYDPKVSSLNMHGNLAVFDKKHVESFVEDISIFSKE